MTKISGWFLLAVSLCMPLYAAPGKFKRTHPKAQNEYIVTLQPDALPTVREAAHALAKQYGGKVGHVYRRAINGFSVQMTEKQAIALSNNPAVASVEENGILQLSATMTDFTNVWHLDRIDPGQPAGTYTYCTTWHPSMQNPVTIYLFDTGVYAGHSEFLDPSWGPHPWNGNGRVSTGNNFGPEGPFIGGAADPSLCGAMNSGQNLFIHGTAVASAAVGATVGVAKNAYIFPVRLFGCNSNPTVATMINAIDYEVSEAGSGTTHIANFSMYQDNVPDQAALDSAINWMIDSGWIVVTSANNHNQDRCANQSPARVPRVITVGGTTNNPMDQRVNLGTPCPLVNGVPTNCGRGSNFGSCVDIFAPGFAIRTAALESPTAFQTRTDTAATSYASGIVSGVIARYIEQHPTATLTEVWNHLVATSDPVVIDGRSATNRLVRVTPECN